MKKALIAALGAATLVGIDQLIKLWAMNSLRVQGSIPLIPNVLRLLYHENYGAAFGILQNQRLLLVGFTLLVLGAGLTFIARGSFHTLPGLTAATLILGGGAGNLLDRILRGFVVDYIYFEPINFPDFNFADICVVTGTGLLLLGMLVMDRRHGDWLGLQRSSR